jgi:rare lipoprotein A
MDIAVKRHTTVVVSALAALMLSFSAVATAQPATTPTESATPLEQLDSATRELADLEERIAELEAERFAIETRLDVLDTRIATQLVELERAREALRDAREIYGDRVVSMYKHGSANPFLMLLSARSLEDLVARGSLLSRIAVQDKALWEHTAKCAADEHYQATVLEDLHAQEKELSAINQSRRLTLERSMERQRELVLSLTDEAEAYLATLRAARAKDRQAWMDSSIPLDAPIDFVPAVVEPYMDRTYLVADYQPLRYESTGRTALMVCSWYGNEFHGRRTASGQVFNENDLTCASRTLAFGTQLALTRGDRRIIAVVTDRGPFISGRDLDLSKAAAQALGFSGVEAVQVEFVEAVSE